MTDQHWATPETEHGEGHRDPKRNQGNVIVEVWDERTSIVLVTFAAIVSFVVMLIARLIVFIPTLPDYAEQANAFALVFSNGPRTIIASVTSSVVFFQISRTLSYLSLSDTRPLL